MAFSIRKMFSNMVYKKPDDEGSSKGNHNNVPSQNMLPIDDMAISANFECIEPDSTSKQSTSTMEIQQEFVNVPSKTCVPSDNNVLTLNAITPTKKEKHIIKKLKLDIKKANLVNDSLNISEAIYSTDLENTPKHILLQNNVELSDRFKNLDLNKSLQSGSETNETHNPFEENIDIESLSDESDSDVSMDLDGTEVKMCRPVSEIDADNQLVPSTSPESFADVELDRDEEDRSSVLLNYQVKFEKLECFLKKLLSEFQFHIEVSKIFYCRSISTLPNNEMSTLPKIRGGITYFDNITRGVSPTGSWNLVMEKEDGMIKSKVQKQLLSMKHTIEQFVNHYLREETNKQAKRLTHTYKSITYEQKTKPKQKHLRIKNKKKIKHFDFPDLRDAMVSLFNAETEKEECISGNNMTHIMSEVDESDATICVCRCHQHPAASSPSQDSGLAKNDHSISGHSITSSIGNFSLDASTLSAYSESLEQIVSYYSFHDTSLYSTLLQKAAIERISFYVQVHSIQIKCESTDQEFESKNVIKFYCPACKITETEENGLLKHILSQFHCEKIHFLYKTAYIKKCMAAGKEIQPSTVLNPMKMYRDDNKIVCFGEAIYACSLCFENMIVGESILMAHCAEEDHIERRGKLAEILE